MMPEQASIVDPGPEGVSLQPHAFDLKIRVKMSSTSAFQDAAVRQGFLDVGFRKTSSVVDDRAFHA